MNSRLLLFLAALLISVCSVAENKSPIQIELARQRNFGYSLGDEIVTTALINTGFGYQLEPASIPKPGPVNNWLTLTKTKLEQGSNGYDYQLQLYYQAFKSVKQSTQLTIPAVELRFVNYLKSTSKSIPSWYFIYNPLILGTTPDNQVSIQGPIKPVYLNTTSHYPVIFWLIMFATLLSLYLVWIYDKLPFFRCSGGPFGRACHTMSQLSKTTDSETNNREALSCFHKAMNECAGKTVFSKNLAEFFQHHPQFSGAKPETEKLFNYSRQLFFSQSVTQSATQREAITTQQMLSLCQWYRKIERGSRWS